MKHGSGVWTSSYTKSNPDTYIGEWRSGKVDGYGVHIWSNVFFIQIKERISMRDNLLIF